MAGKNTHPSEIENLRGGELNRMLDAALAGYSAVEPRAGLEDRIVANLRAEQRRPPNRAWWQWSLAAASATVVLVVLTLAWRSGSRHRPVISNQPPVRVETPKKPNAQAANPSSVPDGIRRHEPVRRAEVHAVATNRDVAAIPKLDKFPSPQPLSAEEIALAHYAKNFPKEAQLVAQAQQEFELETEKEMNRAGSETQASGSIQQER